MLLDQGQIAFFGDPKQATRMYLQAGRNPTEIDSEQFIGTLKSALQFTNVFINGSNRSSLEISPSNNITISIEGICRADVPKFRTTVSISRDGHRICSLHDSKHPTPIKKGRFTSEIQIPAFTLRPGEYFVAIGGHDGDVFSPGIDWLFGNEIASFIITEEWSADNDFANIGVVNIPHNGKRSAHE